MIRAAVSTEAITASPPGAEPEMSSGALHGGVQQFNEAPLDPIKGPRPQTES